MPFVAQQIEDVPANRRRIAHAYLETIGNKEYTLYKLEIKFLKFIKNFVEAAELRKYKKNII